MANLKAIQKRIKTVKSTEQITKAMKMVAATKLKQVENTVVVFRKYSDNIEEIFKGIVSQGSVTGPLLKSNDSKTKLLIAISADRGLCGSFNHHLIKKVEKYLADNKDDEVKVIFVGKKLREYFKHKNINVISSYNSFGEKVKMQDIEKLTVEIKNMFISGEVGKVDILYSFYKTKLTQVPTVKKLLPVEFDLNDESLDEIPNFIDYIYEPDKDKIAENIIEKYFNSVVYGAVIETVTSEYAARMTAMDNATNNARDMIQSLTLKYNRERQAAITKELMEIVTGAEALKN